MRTTSLLLALAIAPACVVAISPAPVARGESLAAARTAVDGAAQHGRRLSKTPLEYALVWLVLPYAQEPVELSSTPSMLEVAAFLKAKQAYWAARLTALESPRPEPSGLDGALDSARAVLREEAAASAIRLILADIEADRAVLRAPRERFSPQDLIDRKGALFQRLSATRIP